MSRLLGATSPYDVLGLAPDATSSEIDSAFDWLIHGNGYRLDVPIHRWPQRLREIKTAYAALGDPVRRRAYDESVRPATALPRARAAAKPRQAARKAPAKTSIVGSGTDAATDALVRPAKRKRAPKKAGKAAVAAAAFGGSEALASHEAPAVPVVEVPRHEPEPVSAFPLRSEAEPIAVEEDEPFVDSADWSTRAISAPVQDRDTFKEDAEAAEGRGRLPLMDLGIAAAVTLSVGALLLVVWPSSDPQASHGREANRSLASVAHETVAQLLPGAQPATPQADVAPPTEPTQSDAAPERTARAAEVKRRAHTEFAFTGGDPAPGNVDGGATDAQPQTAAASPIADAPVPPAQTAPSPPPAAQPFAVARSPGPLGPPSDGPALGTVPPSSFRSAATPPRMIGGGPTDADNRRARYRGAVAVQFAVGTEGRVSNCSVTRSSGNPQLDGMTCRLLVERGRFAPARDAQGRPIQSRINASYVYGRGHRSRN